MVITVVYIMVLSWFYHDHYHGFMWTHAQTTLSWCSIQNHINVNQSLVITATSDLINRVKGYQEFPPIIIGRNNMLISFHVSCRSILLGFGYFTNFNG